MAFYRPLKIEYNIAGKAQLKSKGPHVKTASEKYSTYNDSVCHGPFVYTNVFRTWEMNISRGLERWVSS